MGEHAAAWRFEHVFQLFRLGMLREGERHKSYKKFLGCNKAQRSSIRTWKWRLIISVNSRLKKRAGNDLG
jgi:hypothetical protein